MTNEALPEGPDLARMLPHSQRNGRPLDHGDRAEVWAENYEGTSMIKKSIELGKGTVL